nr:hypothetical protein [Tanacetum cinerariifolium]
VDVKKANDEVNVVEEVVEVIKTAKLIVDAAQVSAAGEVYTASDIVSVASAAATVKPIKPKKKKDQIRLDEKAVLKLQAEFDEKERLAREKAKKEQESNIALIETWDDIQAKIDVDHQLAETMQVREQKELSITEKLQYFNNS